MISSSSRQASSTSRASIARSRCTGWWARGRETIERAWRLGWISLVDSFSEPYGLAFVQRLRELGFAEGRNLVIERRSADGHLQRLPELADDLARQKCDIYFAAGAEANLIALKQASRGTPIVIVANDYDPVAAGHIADLAHPGGRITGVTQLQSLLPAKRIEWTEAGGLLSYGFDFSQLYRRAADLVVRILRGAKAGDIPMEQPAKFELTINKATARALGVAIPPTLLVRADRLIE